MGHPAEAVISGQWPVISPTLNHLVDLLLCVAAIGVRGSHPFADCAKRMGHTATFQTIENFLLYRLVQADRHMIREDPEFRVEFDLLWPRR